MAATRPPVRVNIITARPESEFSARFQAGYGNFDTFEAEGFANVPLGDTFAMRISARTVQQGDGYWRSRLLPGETIGERDILTGRIQLRWQPSADVDVNAQGRGAALAIRRWDRASSSARSTR